MNNSSKANSSRVQSEISRNQLRSNKFECMICCDIIRRFNPIWYCGSCYNIFHLKCAIEWCNKSIKSRNEAIENAQYPGLSNRDGPNQSTESSSNQGGYSNYRQERLNSVEWPCPACREVLHSRPNKYKCFCGKVIRPEVNRHLTPHSCGQLCGRKRPSVDCPHSCNNICHPGRCDPCPLTSKKTCYCGKLTKEVRCTVSIGSCDEICGKSLSCGQHKCSKVCHSGECGSCEEILSVECHCGNETLVKNCNQLSASNRKLATKFSCDKICGKELDCGKHYCKEKCHPGPKCRSCKLLNENIKNCPCGSTVIQKSQLSERKSCTDPIPTCKNKCNRQLHCGPDKNHHRCQKKCHTGSCPPCKLRTSVHCMCKLSTKTIECSMIYEKLVEEDHVSFKPTRFEFKCETRCNKAKNCGRHRCNIKCCDFNRTLDPQIHRCEQTCGRKLPCGSHNCPETCHPGQCGDCTNIGWTELTCHCGSSVMYPPIPCGAKTPACHRPCRRAHSCGHAVRHECHDDTEKCAPCIVFVKKSCFCGADSKDSVYCYLKGYSCGKTCRKMLACKQHTCKKICHDNKCEVPNERGVFVCEQPCQVPRFSCKHPCGLSCHGTSHCPVSECRRMIEISCECGNKKERIECYKLTREQDNRNKLSAMINNRVDQESVMIDISKATKLKESGDSRDKKKLDCDESCSILKRNKALAEALQIEHPDLKPNAFGEDPLRLLKEATAYDYKFVAATFNSIAKLVKSARESDKRFIFMQFPPSEKLRREVIHELAHHFNCTSESRDDEPYRHVVVRAHKASSSIPSFTIEQLIPISD